MSDAYERACERSKRVRRVSNLIRAARLEDGPLSAPLPAIAYELLVRPVHGLSERRPAWRPHARSADERCPEWSSLVSRYHEPEVMAELEESLAVIDRVRKLQATVPVTTTNALCDVEALARRVAPFVRLAFDGEVSVRVMPQSGSFRTPVPDWRVAIVILGTALAFACSLADYEKELEETARTPRDASDEEEPWWPPDSSSFPISTSPPRGRAAVAISMRGLGDLVLLHIASDLADEAALPLGVVSSEDNAYPAGIAATALQLAASCIEPWEGMIDMGPGLNGGAEVSVFLPGDGPPMDGWDP